MRFLDFHTDQRRAERTVLQTGTPQRGLLARSNNHESSGEVGRRHLPGPSAKPEQTEAGAREEKMLESLNTADAGGACIRTQKADVPEQRTGASLAETHDPDEHLDLEWREPRPVQIVEGSDTAGALQHLVRSADIEVASRTPRQGPHIIRRRAKGSQAVKGAVQQPQLRSCRVRDPSLGTESVVTP